MNLFDKDTEQLMHTLQAAGPSELKDYLQEQFAQGEPDFAGYIQLLLERKGLKRQDVLIRANLPQKYGYKLLSGESHTTDRDKILRICFSMEMTLKETQRTLKLYGMNELYPKVRRDVLLISALGQRISDVDRINAILQEASEPPLYVPDAD